LLLNQLKPKHHRLHVLTVFERGVRGAHGAVFCDTRFSYVQVIEANKFTNHVLTLETQFHHFYLALAFHFLY